MLFSLLLISLLPLMSLIDCQVAGDPCQNALGMESGQIEDHQITASSSHEPNSVGPANARLRVDKSGGAWCPGTLIHDDTQEYIEIDLQHPHMITELQTQGRYGAGHGQEFAEAFVIEYWRNGMTNFTRYKSGKGSIVMKGNSNTYTVQKNSLESPFIAQKIRIFPFSQHPRTVCMRIELIGCPYEDGLVSYSTIPAPYQGEGIDLGDDSYDGLRLEGKIENGLGQLIDGIKATREPLGNNKPGLIGGNPWVGWKNESLKPIVIIFDFDQPRTFSSIELSTTTPGESNDGTFGFLRRVELECSLENLRRQSYVFSGFQSAANDVQLKPHDQLCRGNQLTMQIFFTAKWFGISEVSFDSRKLPSFDFSTETTFAKSTELFFDLDQDKTTSKPSSVTEVATDPEWQNAKYLGAAIGVLVTVIVLLLIVVVVIMHKERRSKRRRNFNDDSMSSNSSNFFPSTPANVIYSTDRESSKAFKSFRLSEEADTLSTVLEHPIYSEPFVNDHEKNKNADRGNEAGLLLTGESSSNMEYACPLLLYSNSTSPSINPSPSPPRTSYTLQHEQPWPQMWATSSHRNNGFMTTSSHTPSSGGTPFVVPCYASADICRTSNTPAEITATNPFARS